VSEPKSQGGQSVNTTAVAADDGDDILLIIFVSVMRQDRFVTVSPVLAIFPRAGPLTSLGCKKGNRECEFPQPPSSSKRAKQAENRSPQERTAKTEHKEEGPSVLETIKDESEDEEASVSPTSRPSINARTQSAQSPNSKHKDPATVDPPPKVKDMASPQSTDTSSSRSRADTPASSLQMSGASAEIHARQAKIKTLKSDLQKYLQFHHDHLTHYHYFIQLDPTDFVHNEFIDLALSYEPLLYAIVGFAAYHHELQQPRGKLSRFLGYHSKSLSMLRKSLEQNAKVSEATLLTVLQLALFEEYLGDWVNLVGHHRAAHTMLLDLYKVDTIMETEVSRRIFTWYARFDVIVGLMSGYETRLDRQWFEANVTWHQAQIDNDPEGDIDVENTLAFFVVSNQLVGMDMASLFAKLPKGEISMEEFTAENEKIAQRLDTVKRQMESFNDEYFRVQEFPVEQTRPLTAEDIVNPYIPGGLFKDALWPVNFMWIDWYGIEQMRIYQTSIISQQPIPPDLEQISLEQCRIYEAINRWPEAPAGAVLGAHASLGLATVFLKKDYRHTMWARRKLAEVERLGYIFPPTFRRKMAEIWGLSSDLVGEGEGVEEWWLPNGEGRLPILKEVRKVVEERHENDTLHGVESLSDVRDLRAIFAKLDIRSHGQSTDGLSPRSESSGGGSVSSLSPTSQSFSSDGRGVGPEAAGRRGDQGRRASQAGLSGGGGPPRAAASPGDRMSGIWDGFPEL